MNATGNNYREVACFNNYLHTENASRYQDVYMREGFSVWILLHVMVIIIVKYELKSLGGVKSLLYLTFPVLYII